MTELLNKQDNYNVFFRQLLFLAVLIVIGLTIFHELAFFIGSFLGAITLYIVLRGVMFVLTDRFKWKRWVASMTLVTATTLVFLGLGYLVFEMIASEIPNIDTSKMLQGVNHLMAKVNDFVGYRIVPENIGSGEGGGLGSKTSDLLTQWGSKFLNASSSVVINVFLMLVILYFMLAHARGMEKKASAYLPFEGKSRAVIQKEVKSMIFSNAVGIPLIMLAQGGSACLIYWMLGVNNVLFWGFLTALCGLIPMVGTSLVTVPLGIWLIASGSVVKGIIMIACGLFVIANTDNLFRIILMKKVNNTHPLIVIFGVILGIPFFGFWGIIFGPLLISGFLLLIKIYFIEYGLINPKDS